MNLPALPETIRVDKLTIDRYEEFYGDQQISWIKLILQELESDLEEEEKGKTELISNISLIRRTNTAYKDHLIIQGQIKGKYRTPCVRCLEVTEESLELNISACFLSEVYGHRPDFQEMISLYIDKAKRDLYFYKKGIADIEAVIRENIFMQTNQFPLHREDCRGLCPTCGINLNLSSCSHSNKI